MEALGYAGIPGNGGLRNAIRPEDYANAAQCEPGRISQITQAAERHSQAIAHLDDRLKVLHNRLGAMLRPSDPRTPEKAEQRKPVAMAPFAKGLNQLSEVLDRISLDVQDVLNRLEL